MRLWQPRANVEKRVCERVLARTNCRTIGMSNMQRLPDRDEKRQVVSQIRESQ